MLTQRHAVFNKNCSEKSRVSVPPGLGGCRGWVPGALARSDMVRANAGRPTKATKSALKSFRLTERCGNRPSSDGLQQAQDEGSAPSGRAKGSGEPARDRC